MGSVSTRIPKCLPFFFKIIIKMATGDDVKKDIESFKRDSLSTVETNEKNVLPDAEAIEAEKKELERKDEIENFDKSALKKQETIEKNSLPTQEQIEEEKNANA